MKRQGSGQKQSGEKTIRVSEDLLWGVHPVFEGLEKEPDRFTEIILQKDIIWMLLITLMILPLMIMRREVGRVDGLILLIVYSVYIYTVVV